MEFHEIANGRMIVELSPADGQRLALACTVVADICQGCDPDETTLPQSTTAREFAAELYRAMASGFEAGALGGVIEYHTTGGAPDKLQLGKLRNGEIGDPLWLLDPAGEMRR